MHLSLLGALPIGHYVPPPAGAAPLYSLNYYVGERCTSERVGRLDVSAHPLQRMCYPTNDTVAGVASSVLVEVKPTARARYTFETWQYNCGGWEWGKPGSRVLVSPNERYCMLLSGSESLMVYPELRRS